MTHGPEDRDEPTVELVDDRPPSRRSGRWPQVALLGAAVLVVVVVGLLDRGGDDETSLPTTTTTSPPTTRPTTTRVRPPTTTTSLPRFEAGDGPLLPDGADTELLTISSDGLVTIHDLASGDRCINAAGGQETWIPFPASPVAAAVALQTEQRLMLVDARCTLRPIAVNSGYPVAMTDDAVWYLEDDSGALQQVRLDGRPGRRIVLPINSGPNVLAAGDRLVLTSSGSITLLDPATDARRDLGTGWAIAATPTTVAVVSCPRLECRLSMLDLATGRRRRLADPRLGAAGAGAFSPDGRRFVAATRDEVLVVDVRAGTTVPLDAESLIGFTADSGWVLVMSTGNVIAIRPDGTNRKWVTNVGGVNGIAVVHTPRDY